MEDQTKEAGNFDENGYDDVRKTHISSSFLYIKKQVYFCQFFLRNFSEENMEEKIIRGNYFEVIDDHGVKKFRRDLELGLDLPPQKPSSIPEPSSVRSHGNIKFPMFS